VKEKEIESALAELPPKHATHLKTILKYAETQKGVLGVLATSLTHKIYKPRQDIRYHQESMKGGYSGRSFDTRYVTPFFQEKFPHYAMRESAWLTRSLEQPRPYTLNYAGHIQSKNLKTAFLELLDLIQKDKTLASRILTVLFALLIEASNKNQQTLVHAAIPEKVLIKRIIKALHRHIFYEYTSRGAARLPVLAIYAVYKILVREGLPRFANKKLAPLGAHTSPDSRSGALGDIEVIDDNGECYEAVEIKHLKPITLEMVNIAYQKIRSHPISRYYILTTHEPDFSESESVDQRTDSINEEHGSQIILNGVISTVKYYLRLITKPQDFVEVYTSLLQEEFNRSSGIKTEHLQAWAELRKKL
jgi:DNA (cytosine-5)-methyltransferase 1